MLDKFFDFIINFLDLFRFWVTKPPEHAGFVRRFGVPVRDLHDGLNFLLPFNIETTTTVDMRQWSDVLPAQSLRTRDGVDYVVRLMVSYRVVDPKHFVLKVFDATNNVQDAAAGALGAAFTRATRADVDEGRVLKKVRAAVTSAAKHWGVEIVKVQFTDVVPAPSFRLFGAVKDEN